MKNKKNTLITGVALAIALFTSVQVNALGANRKVNPFLTSYQREYLESYIKITNDYAQQCRAGKSWTPKDCPSFEKFNSRLESIYYGNRSYTEREFENIVDRYRKEFTDN